MGIYQIAPLPGAPPDESRRVLGINSLEQPTFLSRACLLSDPATHRLRSLTRLSSDTPFLAGVVEVGENVGWVWVVEQAVPSVGLDVIAARASSLRKPMPPEIACWLALRLCEACHAAGTPHLRLSPRNVFVQPSGELFVLGATWARLLPPNAEDAPWTPPFEDARTDAFAAAEMARLLAGGAEGWALFSEAARTALEHAGAGPRRTCLLTPVPLASLLRRALGPELAESGAARLASYVSDLGIPRLAMKAAGGRKLVLAPMNEEPLLEVAGAPHDVTLAIDGRLDGRPAAREPAEPPAVQTRMAPAVSNACEVELELDEHALFHATGGVQGTPGPDMADPMPQRPVGSYYRGLAAGLVGLVLAVGFNGFAMMTVRAAGPVWAERLRAVPLSALGRAFDELQPRKRSRGTDVRSFKGDAPLLLVQSEPEGATVRIGSDVLGETPFFGSNDLPDGTWALYVEKPGFEPKRLQIRGGRSADFNVTLVPRGRPAQRQIRDGAGADGDPSPATRE